MKRFALAVMVLATVIAQPQPQPPYQPPPYQTQPQGQPLGQPPGQPGPGPYNNDTGDAPDRGVARISFMNGNVSVRRGDSGDLVDAVLNAPLTATDRVVTADGARAEVQFDSANLIRLGPSTEVRLSELAYEHFQIQVATGTTTFRVLRDSNAQVEISTPSVSVHPAQKGVYRVTVKPDGTSEITVRSGNADIFSPRGSQPLHGGQTMLARGSASDPEFQVTGQIPQDDLDRWAAARDQQLERASSPRYVSPDVYGTEDLDANGRWANDPQYGNVWVPSVDPGWAPYRCGRWTWVDFYGWTWVGCESWGWAPYHYGRWYWGSLGWAWYPGPIFSHYYWRPALVGFFGWGGGVGIGVGFGFGNVGWVPLAPFERFHPWYGAGFGGGFRGGVGVVANTNIASAFRNARIANGVTSVRAGEFGHGGVSNANFVRASAGDLSRAGMVRGQLPVEPSRGSTQFSNRAANTQGLPRTSENTHFFSHSSGAPSSGSSASRFEQRQGVGPGQRSAGENAGAGANTSGGWRRFDSSAGRPAQSNGVSGGNRSELERPQNSAPSRSYGAQQNSAPSRGYSSQQQLRVSPPIIQNRGNSSGGAARGSSGVARSGGGGGSHGGGGGSHGGHH